ncbi:class I SAM-dependent methyltransferase [Breznakiella homolactica]|uniref:Class I SAM-dependent methyltransferase n=1 Tax=Breznakiella homolactica TaxID=2798577 RepID=A0A7T8B9W8_9SPIR|nr:class I SAM-dependent methyltransferase [Breznakiella homolactica]QQO08751.1 class I SAM-dependent methyltransferase [Breznakiella homolactica]
MKKTFIKYVAEQFARPEGIGGTVSTFIMNRMNRKQYQAVSGNIHIKPDETILDIGFGNGYMIKKLNELRPRRIYGIEISEDMVRKGRKKFMDAANVTVLKADIAELPMEDRTIDKIYTINTCYFWNDAGKSFSEIKRVLRENGLFLNAFYTKNWLDTLEYTNHGFKKYTLEELAEMTGRYGFRVKDIIEISTEKSYCIVAEKISA